MMDERVMNLETAREWGRLEVVSLCRFIISSPLLQKNQILSCIERIMRNIKTLEGGDIYFVTGACKLLVDQLASFPYDTFSAVELVSVVKGLVSDFSPSEWCPANVETNLSFPIIRLSNVHATSTDIEDLYRMNALHIVSSGLMTTVLRKCFSNRETEDVESAIDGAIVFTTDLELTESQERIALICKLLECKWPSLKEGQLRMLRSLALCLLFHTGCLVVAAEPSAKYVVQKAVSSVEKILWMTSGTLDDSCEFSARLVRLFSKLIDVCEAAKCEEEVMQCVLRCVPLLAAEMHESAEKLPRLLWQVARCSARRLALIDDENEEQTEQLTSPTSHNFDELFNKWFITVLSEVNIAPPNKIAEHLAQMCEDAMVNLAVESCAYEESSCGDLLQSLLVSLIKMRGEVASQLSDNCARMYISIAKDHTIAQERQVAILKALMSSFDEEIPPSAQQNLLHIVEALLVGGNRDLSALASHLVVENAEKRELSPWCLLVFHRSISSLSPSDSAQLVARLVQLIAQPLEDRVSPRVKSLLSLLHLLQQNNKKLSQLESLLDFELEDELCFAGTGGVCCFSDVAGKEYEDMLNSLALFLSEQSVHLPLLVLPPPSLSFLQRLMTNIKEFHLFIFYFRVYYLLNDLEYSTFVKNWNGGGSECDATLDEFVSEEVVTRQILALFVTAFQGKKLDELKECELSSLNSVLQHIFSALKEGWRKSLPSQATDFLRELVQQIERSEFSSVCGSEEEGRSAELLSPVLKNIVLSPDNRKLLLDALPLDLQNLFQKHASAYAEHNSEQAKKDGEGARKVEERARIHSTAIAILRLHSATQLSKATSRFVSSFLVVESEKNEGKAKAARFLISDILTSLCQLSPKQLFEFTRLENALRDVMRSLCCSEKAERVDWENLNREDIAEALMECSQRGAPFSLPLLDILHRLVADKKTKGDACQLLLSFFNEEGIQSVPSFIHSSYNRLSVFNALGPVLRHCAVSSEGQKKAVKSALLQMVEPLFDDVITRLHDCFDIEVQSTDRFAQTQLKWRWREGSRASEVYGNGSDPVKETLVLVAELADRQVFLEILRVFSEHLEEWLNISQQEEMALRGVTLLEDSRVVWRVLLLSHVFSFCFCLGQALSSSDSSTAPSQEELAYLEMWRTPSEGVLEREEMPGMAGGDECLLSLCTYAATRQEFTSQHWYNCHSCGMTDTVGVCSVCAVNCHRGHDLSYSKYGSFFCDCGDRRCSSLSTATHSVMRGSGSYHRRNPALSYGSSSSRSATESCFSFSNTFQSLQQETLTSEEFVVATEKMKKALESSTGRVQTLIEAIESASDGRWNLSSRRKDTKDSLREAVIKYDECIMLQMRSDRDGLEALETRRPGESLSLAGNYGEMCALIETATGSSVLALVTEASTLTLLHSKTFTFSDASDTRVEREGIPVTGRRISSLANKLAIVGSTEEVLCMRFDHHAHILDRECIRLVDSPSSNPIVKAIWAPDRHALLAVATLQYVRIYDVTKDTEQFEMELVLPMGNVVDLSFVKKESDDFLWLVVLCSAGHLYYFHLSGPDPISPDTNNSIFLTCTVQLPSLNNSVSLFYSSTCNMLFVSVQNGTFYAFIQDGDVSKLEPSSFHKLEMPNVEGLCGWSEAAGVISALTHPSSTRALFIYPTFQQILVQVHALPAAAYALCIGCTATSDSIVAVALLNGYRRPAIVFKSSWVNQPDLWMRELPRQMEEVAMPQEEGVDEAGVIQEDLVTIFETTDPMTDIEYSSHALSIFYDNNELTQRLKLPGARPVSTIHMAEFDVTLHLTRWQWLMRGLRIEVLGGKAPVEVRVLGRSIPLSTGTNRYFDIRFSYSDALLIDKRVTLTFVANRVGPTTIVSLRAFGEHRVHSEWARHSLYFTWPPSLPSHFISSLSAFLTLLKNTGLPFTDEQWCQALALKFVSPRSGSSQQRELAGGLLKAYTDSSLSFHRHRDNRLFISLALFRECGPNIPQMMLYEFLMELKVMLILRFDNFIKNTKTYFSDALSLCAFLRGELEALEGDPSPALKTYAVIVLVLLSAKYDHSKELIMQLLSVFTEEKTRKLAYRLRSVILSLVGAYRLALGGEKPPSAEKTAILFYQTPLPVGDKLAFGSQRLPWVVSLLCGLLDKIKDSGSQMFSVLLTGCEGVTSSESHSSNALVTLAISLFDFLDNTEDILSCVDHMFSLLNTETSVTPTNYSEYLLLRVVLAFLKQGSSSPSFVVAGPAPVRQPPDEEDDPEESDQESSATISRLPSATATASVSETMKDSEKKRPDKVAFLKSEVVKRVLGCGVLEQCFRVLASNVTYWKGYTEPMRVPQSWSPEATIVPEVAPFGLRQANLVNNYTAQMSDLSLRLPLYIIKNKPDIKLDQTWLHVLCELCLLEKATPIQRASRRLLIASQGGSKEAYKTIRDDHIVQANLDAMRRQFLLADSFTHSMLTEMSERSTRILSIANHRPQIWRAVCEKNVGWLLLLACKTADPVAAMLLELLLRALRASAREDAVKATSSDPSVPPSPSSVAECRIADEILRTDAERNLLKVLLVRHLIGRDEPRRWLLHGLCRSLMQLSNRNNQVCLAKLLWQELWPLGRALGARSAQLADLLSSYLASVLPSPSVLEVVEEELCCLQLLQSRIDASGQFGLLRRLQAMGLGWREALVLDPEPCLICLSRSDSSQPMRLSAIKQEARFTTTAMMYKLHGHYEVARVVIKLSDVKKTRQFRRVNLYYVARAVDSALDVKSRPSEWQKAASARVGSNDMEVTLSVAIPVVTSALVIEFAELTEQRVAAELHCPRCSSSVRPNPGVCDNCGENVFQCVKCRVINYDEKEPFLCSSCGFCKYARMEVTVICRPQASVYPITTEAERAATLKSMSKLMVEMEQSRAQLEAGRALLETFSSRCPGAAPPITLAVESQAHADALLSSLPSLAPSQSGIAGLAACAQQLRSAHDELSASTCELLALREALRVLDHPPQSTRLTHPTLAHGFYSTCSGCIGCLTVHIIHSLAIIRSLCDDEAVAAKVAENTFIYGPLVSLSRSVSALEEETENLLVRLAECTEGGSRSLCELVQSGRLPALTLVASLQNCADSQWMHRFATLVKVAVSRKEDEETAECTLQLLSQWLAEAKVLRRNGRRREKRVTTNNLSNLAERSSSKSRAKRSRGADPLLASSLASFFPDEPVFSQFSSPAFLKELDTYIWGCVFSPSVSVRGCGCRLLRSVLGGGGDPGTAICLLLRGLRLASEVVPSRSTHFFVAAHSLCEKRSTKLRLFSAHFHVDLARLCFAHARKAQEAELSDSPVRPSDGLLLQHAAELLWNVLSGGWVESAMLSAARLPLLLPLFQSCILLRRVQLKRSRAHEKALAVLERLLRRVASSEASALITVAVSSLAHVNDVHSQADIVGVILDTLDPEKKSSDDFLVQLEKEPAQEDFLQGRMQHNPYRSSDAGMGPLMRNVKDKICRECELVALLEDDNGMELLVKGKIVSLSLPVRAVYEKLWKPEHPGEPMVVIYRMRGLLGDAVEPFVETLDEEIDGSDGVPEEEASLMGVLSRAGGIERCMTLLKEATLTMAGQLLLNQLRKLFAHAIKMESTRRQLMACDSVTQLLRVFRLVLESGSEESLRVVGAPFLHMLEALVCDLRLHPELEGVSEADLAWLLENALDRRHQLLRVPSTCAFVPGSIPEGGEVILSITKILPNICLGNDSAEDLLVRRFKEDLNWSDHLAPAKKGKTDDRTWLVEVYCMVADAILNSEKASRFKHKLLHNNIVHDATAALLWNHPPLYAPVESAEWKAYLARPNVKMILRLLRGMARGHERSQKEIAKNSLHLLHRLEQISSADHVGTLAESVMEELRQSKEVAALIEGVRQETKQKKRQLAMAMRDKQLSRLGMQLGRKGELKVSSRSIASEPELEAAAEPAISCCICRESVVTGRRVAVAYAFAAKLTTGNWAPTHSTVSLMLMVHSECHYNAIRRSTGGRNADEWTKASLHNAGAKTNCLVPVAVASPSSSDWNAAISRLQADLDVVVQGAGPLTRLRLLIDMTQLMRRFVSGRSFSEQTGGGGRESNMQYLAVLHLLALKLPAEDLPSGCLDTRLAAFLLTEHSLLHWNEQRVDVLRASLGSEPRDGWPTCKQHLLMWALVDKYFNQVIPIEGEDRLDWLQSHFEETLTKTLAFVANFDSTIMPAKDPEELCQAIGIDIGDIVEYLTPSPAS